MVFSEKTINSRLNVIRLSGSSVPVFQPVPQPGSPHNWSAIDCKVKLFRTLSSADSQLSFPVYCRSFYLLTCKYHLVTSNPPVSHAEVAKLYSLSNLYQLVFSRGGLFQTAKRRSYAKCSQRGAFLETLVDPGQGVKVQSSRVKENFIIPKGQFDLRSTKWLISHTHKHVSLSVFLTYIGFHSFSIRLHSITQTLSSDPPSKPSWKATNFNVNFNNLR